MAVVAVVAGIWLAWSPATRTVAERGGHDTAPGGSANYGELADLDGDCPPVLSGSRSEATLDASTISPLVYDLPSGFSEVTGFDERNARSIPGGVLDTAKAGAARTETRLYSAEWRAQHGSPEPPPSTPSERPEHPAAKIVSFAGRTVLFFDEPAKPHRSAAWLQDENVVVEVVAEGLDETEFEVIVATTRRPD